MIKFVVNKITSFGTIEQYVELCNLLNKIGYECTIYSLNDIFKNKCKSAPLSSFIPQENDFIILDNLPVRKINDLYNLAGLLEFLSSPLTKNKLKYRFKRWLKIKKGNLKRHLTPDKPKNFDLILNWQTFNEDEIRQTNLKLYDAILLMDEKQKQKIAGKYKNIVLPLFSSNIEQSIKKPAKVAGILAPISKFGRIKKSINEAIKDGMEKIYLYGRMEEPKHYYEKIAPILAEYKGRIQYCGPISDKQKIYDSVSDVYDFSEYRANGTLELECNLSGTTLHTNQSLSPVVKTNDEIIEQLEKETNLEKQKKSEITVILNGYKRGKNLDKQIESLQKQTVRPDDIMLWYNNPGEGIEVNNEAVAKTKAAVSNENWGVWARFYYAMNAKTKYICVFDDDTIPGEKWLENCLNTIKTHRGLLGTVGLVYESKENYFDNVRYGWVNPNEEVKEVDIVGHSWFFEKEFLTAFCRELPLLDVKICGEDIHFSYTLQKYFGLKTFVPPHPKNDKSMWGSLKGEELGIDKHAISCQHIVDFNGNFLHGVNDYFKECQKNGWQLIKFRGGND